jgi:hypothetical protein
MICTCKDWQDNMPTLDQCLVMAFVHGFSYTGTTWKYCPWCGKELQEGNMDE